MRFHAGMLPPHPRGPLAIFPLPVVPGTTTMRAHTEPKHLRRRLASSPFRILSYRLVAFLAVLGPGFITANVDNDPGGILTYSQAGAKYGYTLLWTLIPTTIALIVVQEMAARMGAVTGKGLSDLIREEFGLRMTFFTMVVLGLADLGNIVAEFAGIASGMGIFGVSKYIAVPLGAALVWVLVVRGSYKQVERVLLASFADLLHLPDLRLPRPSRLESRARQHASSRRFSRDPAYIAMIVGLIGTTITPWMQFYLQASIVEKGITRKDLQPLPCGRHRRLHRHRRGRLLHRRRLRRHDLPFQSPRNHRCRRGRQGPRALRRAVRRLLFGVGLINASLMSAAILPLATAYNICEGLGFESGINRRFQRGAASSMASTPR